MSTGRNFVPCHHKELKNCDCLTEREKEEDNIYFYHYENFCCNAEHAYGHHHFDQNGYYKVERPCWKQHCFNPIAGEYGDKLEKIWKIFQLNCTCSTRRICRNCNHLVKSGEDYNPQLYLGHGQLWDVLKLVELFPYLNL